MGFTIYFALVALANIFLGYFLAMKLGLAVPGVANASETPETEAGWEGKKRAEELVEE
jgi:hypothetical protein